MKKNITKYNGFSRERLEDILQKITKLRIALIGDICLDVYWKADMTKSVISRETPHFPLPVTEEWMSPGAGGNTAANIAELGVANFKVLSVIGGDWRGAELKTAFLKRGIQTDYLTESDQTVTNAYCKPLRQRHLRNRIRRSASGFCKLLPAARKRRGRAYPYAGACGKGCGCAVRLRPIHLRLHNTKGQGQDKRFGPQRPYNRRRQP